MDTSAKISILISFLVGISRGLPMTCKQDTCSHPKVVDNFDFLWFRDTAPSDGWHMEIGNKVTRLHIAELIQGKLLTYDNDYSQMCAKIKLVHADIATEGLDGNYFGYDNKTVNFVCHNSETEKGVFDCDYSSTGFSKYAEKVVNYITYSDNKNVMVVIKCFANGESGWVTVSKTTSLTEEENKAVLDHVKAIGYDPEDNVPMYNENCPSVAE